MYCNENTLAAKVLHEYEITFDTLIETMNANLQPPNPDGKMALSQETKKALENAVREAKRFGHPRIGTGHMLIGVLSLQNPVFEAMLRQRHIRMDDLKGRAYWLTHDMKRREPKKVSKPGWWSDISSRIGLDAASSDLYDDEQALDEEQKLTMMLGIVPNSAKLIFNLGNLKVSRKDFYGAIECYSRALAVQPDFAPAYANRGSAQINLKDYESAVTDLSQAISLNPSAAANYVNRSVARDDLTDYDGAMADATEALRLNPDLTTAYLMRSRARFHLKDYVGAIADANDALPLNPELSDPSISPANPRIRPNNFEAAIADLTEAIRLQPDSAAAYHNRGIARGVLAAADAALTDHNEAIRLKPDYAEAYVSPR